MQTFRSCPRLLYQNVGNDRVSGVPEQGIFSVSGLFGFPLVCNICYFYVSGHKSILGAGVA